MSQETEETPTNEDRIDETGTESVSTQQSQPSEELRTQTEPESRELDASSSRPRRNARKSVLYNNSDYELHIPGLTREVESLSTALEPGEAPPFQKSAAKRVRVGENVVRGAKKRKAAPHLEEMMIGQSSSQPLEDSQESEISSTHTYIGGARLQLGAETEVADCVEDEGPPILNLSTAYEDRIHLGGESVDELGTFADDEDFLDGQPPDLELNLPLKRRVRRPKKRVIIGNELVAQDDDDDEKKEKKQQQQAAPRPNAIPRTFRVQGERVISKALADRQFNVKLFEDEVEITDAGDCYATVISGCLAYLLRKERIIELLTNETEVAMIREGGWMLDRPPRLPPLVQHKACFAFMVDGTKMMSIKDVSNDDLKPWSSSGELHGDPVIKPNVRRHPVARVDGRLQSVKGDPRLAELHLTEYSAWLPRLLRLRKKIFYLSRDGQIYGNILILYDYTCPGEAPVVVNLPHGNDYLRNAMIESASDPNNSLDLDDGPGNTPFEDEIIEGPRGGTFLRVKPSKLGWAHNKKLLLKYLVNDASVFDQTPCLNRRVPFMPPLLTTVGVFVYFVPSNYVANQIHHTGDGLSPWTVNPHGETPSPRVRSTRRAVMQDENGMFLMGKDPSSWQQSQLCLVETMSVLARCPRLRKRVIYIQRNNSIILGNVCYIYEYVREGPIPTPVVKGAAGTSKPQQIDQWIEQKKADPGLEDSSHVPSTSSDHHLHVGAGDTSVVEDDQFIDVEDIEVVEEEVIGHDSLHDIHHQSVQMHMQPMQDPLMDDDMIEMSQEDVLNNGYDVEFDDDPLSQQENPAPYFENPRQLDTGHIYLTVRHKRIASSFESVLEWIANSNVVEERGLLNYAKPGHPPIVRNARAYAFFVAGTAIFPHDINRDDFSPWSHNGNAQNPTCYRTKVKKVGIVCDDMGSQFQQKDADYKTCPFHLIFLYSINPREPRLRKKIYYMMETESRLIVSHALIIYDYNQEGELPRMHGGYLKRFSKRVGKRPFQPLQIHDIDNDVSDISESEKECPFEVPPQVADDGSLYLQLIDMDFWNDRNRQLHWLVNKPSLIEAHGCLNNRVPSLPPAITGKGAFVFFVDGLEVDARNLTCDDLVPWSENSSNNPHGVTRRPKSSKVPLALNRDGQLRVWKTPVHRGEHVEFQLHIYSATLPRCPRLRKKVSYVLKNGRQVGQAMIIYWYTESGEIPTPINTLSQEYNLQRLPPHIREEVMSLMSRMTPPEAVKIISEKYGINVNPSMLYYVRRRGIMAANSDAMRSGGGGEMHGVDPYEIKNEILEATGYIDEWTHSVDPSVPSTSSASVFGKQKEMHEILDEADMQVAHTEEIEQPPPSLQSHQRQGPQNKRSGQDHMNSPHETKGFLQPRGLLQQSGGMIRGSNRNDAIWRIARNSFGSTTDVETFDMLFKMLFDKNEQRLLHVVNQTFGVEILPAAMENGEIIHMTANGEIVEEIVEEEVVENLECEGDGEESKVYMEDKTLSDGLEQVIVEEVVDDHLLEDSLVEGVIVEEVDVNAVVIEEHDIEE